MSYSSPHEHRITQHTEASLNFYMQGGTCSYQSLLCRVCLLFSMMRTPYHPQRQDSHGYRSKPIWSVFGPSDCNSFTNQYLWQTMAVTTAVITFMAVILRIALRLKSRQRPDVRSIDKVLLEILRMTYLV